MVSAQKEWKEEWSGLENIKEEANDEPEEMFVGKKSYIYFEGRHGIWHGYGLQLKKSVY